MFKKATAKSFTFSALNARFRHALQQYIGIDEIRQERTNDRRTLLVMNETLNSVAYHLNLLREEVAAVQSPSNGRSVKRAVRVVSSRKGTKE